MAKRIKLPQAEVVVDAEKAAWLKKKAAKNKARIELSLLDAQALEEADDARKEAEQTRRGF